MSTYANCKPNFNDRIRIFEEAVDTVFNDDGLRGLPHHHVGRYERQHVWPCS